MSVFEGFNSPTLNANKGLNNTIKVDGEDNPRPIIINRTPSNSAKFSIERPHDFRLKERTKNKERNCTKNGNYNNFQSSSEIDEIIANIPFKSVKRKSSWGLNFTAQIFKDAKHLFNKKKDQKTDCKELGNVNNELSYEKSCNSKINNIFPHIIGLTPSCKTLNFEQNPRKPVSKSISSFKSISSKPELSPYSSSNSSKYSISQKNKHWKKPHQKVNKENERNLDEIVMIENGNFRPKAEIILNEENDEKFKVCEYSRGNFFILRENLKYEKCFCSSRKKKSKLSRKHRKALPLPPKKDGGMISSDNYSLSSTIEESFKDEKLRWRGLKSKRALNSRRDIQRQKVFRNYGLPFWSSSSCSYCDSTSDDQGAEDTPFSSSGKCLTSNLSLLTSVEGEEENLFKRGRDFEKIVDDLDPVIRDLSTFDVTEVNYGFDDLTEKTYLKKKESKSIFPTRSSLINDNSYLVTTAAATTTTSTSTTIIATTKTTSVKETIPFSKFSPRMSQEHNHFDYRHLASDSQKVATIGISSMINKECEFLRGLTPYGMKGGSHLLFDLNKNITRKTHKNKYTLRSSESSKEFQASSESLEADSMKGNGGNFALNLDQEYLYIPIKGSQHMCHMRRDCETSLKLENVSQHYEERITELHSVIAELTRKLERQKEDIILEEEEEEYEEDEEVREEYEDDVDASRCRRQRKRSKSRNQREGISLSEMSSHEQNEKTECSTSDTAESDGIYNADEGHDAGPQPSTDISTSCDIDDRAVEAGQCIADLEVEECRGENNGDINLCQPTNNNGTDEILGDDVMCQESSSLGVEEEIKILREENLNLQQALALSHHKASSQRAVILALSREREMFKRKVKELERMHPGIPHTSPHISDAIMVKGLRGSPLSVALSTPLNSSLDVSVNNTSRAVSPSVNSQPHEEEPSTQEGVKVICKLAERVRLKKAESGDFRVTGSELSNYGVTTTGVAEQLAAGLQEESDAQELYHALATAGGAFAPHERLKEYELEAERLHSRIDHLRAQNDVLAATLCESKACCDRLALKTGRAEAQSGALGMGVEVLDQIQEAFEVLTALHEAQIGLLVVTCQVTGVDLGTELGFESLYQDADPLIRIKRAQEQRRTAENVARHLISRLEEARPKSLNADSNGIHSMSSSTSSFCSEGTHQEEYMLREMISRLQKERTRILSGFKGGDDTSPMEDYFPPKPPLNEEEAHKFDLENAVLMQELTAIREDRAELRAQVYLLEREKTGLELRVGTCEAQAAAYIATIDHLKSQLNETKSSPSNPQESVEDSGAETCSSEAESLRREGQLKNRIDDLVATLEKVTKNSEARHQQSQEFISDLKKANSALLTAIDRLKKKYALRVKRMEQQMLNLVAKHEEQVKLLKNRISAVEEQLRMESGSPHPLSLISSNS